MLNLMAAITADIAVAVCTWNVWLQLMQWLCNFCWQRGCEDDVPITVVFCVLVSSGLKAEVLYLATRVMVLHCYFSLMRPRLLWSVLLLLLLLVLFLLLFRLVWGLHGTESCSAVRHGSIIALLFFFKKKNIVSVSRTNKGGTVRIPSELLELDFSVLARLYAVKVNGCSQCGASCACCIRFSRLSQVMDDHAYYIFF